MRIVVRRRSAAHAHHRAIETELGWEFIQIYGLTETTPLLTMNRTRAEYDDLTPADRAAKLNRAGAPASGGDGASTPRAKSWPGQPRHGRLLGAARTTADAAIHDGGLPHRRRRLIDDDNYVTISDRKKDVIISGGENVSSIEVEDALFQHPDVAEVAVIGVPDEKWGELVMALVVTHAGLARSPRTT